MYIISVSRKIHIDHSFSYGHEIRNLEILIELEQGGWIYSREANREAKDEVMRGFLRYRL